MKYNYYNNEYVMNCNYFKFTCKIKLDEIILINIGNKLSSSEMVNKLLLKFSNYITAKLFNSFVVEYSTVNILLYYISLVDFISYCIT